MADRDQRNEDPVGDAPINPTSGLRENRSGIVDGATGAKSQARRVAQAAGGTGTGGHAGTGAEDMQATPGRAVSAGSTGGDGFVGGSAMGDEGVGNPVGGIVGGLGSVGGAGGGQSAGGGMSGGVDDVASSHGLGLESGGNAQGPKKGIAG